MLVDAPVNLAAAAARLTETWSPRVVARVNDNLVKVARVHGEFAWHDHAREDELFLVLDGELTIAQGGAPAVTLGPGDVYVVPRGRRHRPSAARTTLIALFEPAVTAHTGAEATPFTRTLAQQLRPVDA